MAINGNDLPGSLADKHALKASASMSGLLLRNKLGLMYTTRDAYTFKCIPSMRVGSEPLLLSGWRGAWMCSLMAPWCLPLLGQRRKGSSGARIQARAMWWMQCRRCCGCTRCCTVQQAVLDWLHQCLETDSAWQNTHTCKVRQQPGAELCSLRSGTVLTAPCAQQMSPVKGS